MIGKTNSINLLGGGDTQTARYITVADTLANLVQAFKDGDTSAYFTPLKQQCDIWLSSGNGNVNFVPKPCIISFTDSKLLLSNYSSTTYGSQYAHLYWFSGLLEGRVYYEIQIGILTNTAATETASSNYEVADVYVSDYSFVDNNVSIGTSSADTSGTITEEQLNILENNDHKLIYFYGDYFRKNHYYASKLIYTCLTYNDTNETLIKFITINGSTREWQLTTKKVEGGGGGGVEVIEKTANQDGTFTAALTADEFNKLAANTATLKLTYMYLGIIPVILNLANPISATVQNNTTLAYTVGVPLALNVVLLPTIISTDLTKIDLSIQIKDSTPITTNGNDDKFDSISDYPLLGFAEDIADVSQLAIPKSFLIGSCLYSNGTWNWDSPSGSGIVSTKYLDSWLTHINLYTTDINATTLEAILLIKTESALPGVEAYKRYSTIVHIGGTNTESSSGKLGSEGLFTVYDTTTHKPIYITFEVSGDATNHLQIPNFKAYQDGADITATFLTKVYGIKFYLL